MADKKILKNLKDSVVSKLSEKDSNKSDKELSYDLVEEGKKAILEIDKRKKFEKALELFPENVDAKLALIKLENDPYFLITSYENLLNEIDKMDLSKEDYAKEIYKVKYLLFLEYDLNKQYLKAEEILKDLLELNKNNNNLKYLLFSNYVKSYSYDKAEDFIKKEKDISEDIQILIPYLVMNILNNDDEKGKDILERIVDINENIYIMFKGSNWDYKKIGDALNKVDIEKSSIEELFVAISNIMPLIFNNSYVFSWIKNNLKAYKEKENIFTNIKSQQLTALEDLGLTSKDDFAKITEEELVDKKYIGEKTIEQLKENGVKFKKED